MERLRINGSTIELIQGDITKQGTDAIVNAANSSLMGGGGVDGAIHRAGGPAILQECEQIVVNQGGLPAGEAVITTGGNLKAKYVIHTVGPIWRGGNSNEPAILRNCYTNSLNIAKENGIKTISFPSVSTGVYSYPVEKAAKVALQAVVDFLKKNDSIDKVYFILFDDHTYKSYSTALKNLSDV